MFYLRFGFLVAAVAAILLGSCESSPRTRTKEAVVEAPVVLDSTEAALVQAFEAFLQDSIRKGTLPGLAVAMVRDDRVLLLKGMGLANSASKAKVDAHTVFRLGSVSKVMAAYLTATLVEQGIFDWNAPVSQYLPEYSGRTNKKSDQLSVRHVLSHSGGFPYHAYTNLIEEGKTLEELLALLARVKPHASPGEEYSYQNVAYSLIQPMVEKATGKPFSSLLETNIWTPLNMKDASCTLKEIQANPNHAVPHQGSPGHWTPVPLSPDYYNTLPAGGINASARDMAQWMKALLGHAKKNLRDSIREDLFLPRVKTPLERRHFASWDSIRTVHYGTGCRVVNTRGIRVLYHGGMVNDFIAQLAWLPDHGFGVCVLMNAPTGLSRECIPAFLNLWKKYYLPESVPTPSSKKKG
jgi:beta-lactamase class C